MTSQKDSGKRNVVVTGFGLFRDHTLNPSWEAIRDGQLKIDLANIHIITKRLDVSYTNVDKVVDELWQTYDPILMVHVGLAAHESHIRIEQTARHGPYLHDDVEQCAPHRDLRDYGQEAADSNVKFTCKPCHFESSATCVNVEEICDRLNDLHREGKLPLPFRASNDAGLYVCEYTYHKSLNICNRAVFIHVPNTVDEITLDDVRQSIQYATKIIIEELQRNQCNLSLSHLSKP